MDSTNYTKQISEIQNAIREREQHRQSVEKEMYIKSQKYNRRYDHIRKQLKTLETDIVHNEARATQRLNMMVARVQSLQKEHKALAEYTQKLRQRKKECELEQSFSMANMLDKIVTPQKKMVHSTTQTQLVSDPNLDMAVPSSNFILSPMNYMEFLKKEYFEAAAEQITDTKDIQFESKEPSVSEMRRQPTVSPCRNFSTEKPLRYSPSEDAQTYIPYTQPSFTNITYEENTKKIIDTQEKRSYPEAHLDTQPGIYNSGAATYTNILKATDQFQTKYKEDVSKDLPSSKTLESQSTSYEEPRIDISTEQPIQSQSRISESKANDSVRIESKIMNQELQPQVNFADNGDNNNMERVEEITENSISPIHNQINEKNENIEITDQNNTWEVKSPPGIVTSSPNLKTNDMSSVAPYSFEMPISTPAVHADSREIEQVSRSKDSIKEIVDKESPKSIDKLNIDSKDIQPLSSGKVQSSITHIKETSPTPTINEQDMPNPVKNKEENNATIEISSKPNIISPVQSLKENPVSQIKPPNKPEITSTKETTQKEVFVAQDNSDDDFFDTPMISSKSHVSSSYLKMIGSKPNKSENLDDSEDSYKKSQPLKSQDIFGSETESIDSVEAAIQASVNQRNKTDETSQIQNKTEDITEIKNKVPTMKEPDEPKVENKQPFTPSGKKSGNVPITLDSDSESFSISAAKSDNEDDDFDFYN